MAALIFTIDVEACLEHLPWRPEQPPLATSPFQCLHYKDVLTPFGNNLLTLNTVNNACRRMSQLKIVIKRTFKFIVLRLQPHLQEIGELIFFNIIFSMTYPSATSSTSVRWRDECHDHNEAQGSAKGHTRSVWQQSHREGFCVKNENTYREISNIRSTKSNNLMFLVSSCNCLCPIHWS